jgi:hypothetical protein
MIEQEARFRPWIEEPILVPWYPTPFTHDALRRGIQGSGRRIADQELMTHVMTSSRDLCDRELLEVVLLQRRQDTRLETLVVPDEHANVCAAGANIV